MNKADYDEHLVAAISNGQLQGITCKREDNGTLEVDVSEYLVRALGSLKGEGVESIADTLGAYGVESFTPDSLERKVLEHFAANQLAMSAQSPMCRARLSTTATTGTAEATSARRPARRWTRSSTRSAPSTPGRLENRHRRREAHFTHNFYI